MMKLYRSTLILLFTFTLLSAQKTEEFEMQSPDGAITLHVSAGAKMHWSVQHKGEQIIAPSAMSMQLRGGDAPGEYAKIKTSDKEKINAVIPAVNYKKAIIQDLCSQLTLNCRNDYGVIFRVYNDAVAYRFFTKKKGEIIVNSEEANFNFVNDDTAFIPYMADYRGGQIFNCSFESFYREVPISKFEMDSLAFLPVMVDIGGGKKVVILEADLEDYPGMFLSMNLTKKGFKGVYAPLPLEEGSGGYNRMNLVPTKRADYIAKTKGIRSFPWRVVVISQSDKELLNNDIVQKLASPSRIADVSWIKPGLVAWDWWNDWNISHVDFEAGINTETYKYYIDFASANKIPYIIMDEGWSDDLDLTLVSPKINLEEIIEHGNQKGVGVILWATWSAMTRQMDWAFPHYSRMGVKGFKIDFIDRDDQIAVASTYEMAKKAAENRLLVDYHGVFKPTGLQRTYPNVVGYEGVRGLEYFKWSADDAMRFALTIPYTRMICGVMDYTPGAMRNAAKGMHRAIFSMPMSQGTRCQQLAMYVVYESPLQMLADNPSAYMKEQECTDFITSIPTTFDETAALDGRVGEYAALARRKGETWFVGAMNNWDARYLKIDFSFLGEGEYEAVVFQDGANAERDGTDYKREVIRISSKGTWTIHLAPGGGWAARVGKVK